MDELNEMMKANPHMVLMQPLNSGKLMYFDPMVKQVQIVNRLPKKMWVYDEEGRLYTCKRDQNGNDCRVYFYPFGTYGRENSVR